MQQLMEATVKGKFAGYCVHLGNVLHQNLGGRFEGYSLSYSLTYRFKREPVLRKLLAGLPLTVLQQRKALIICFSALICLRRNQEPWPSPPPLVAQTSRLKP